MSDILPVIQQLRAQVKRGGVELMTAFRSFDHLRTGRIDLARFRTVLDNQRLIQLTDSQLIALHREYQSVADPSKIDYTRFVIDVEDVPSFDAQTPQPRVLPKELAQANPAQLAATAALASPPATIKLMCEATLERLRAAVSRARLDPEAALRAHDRFRNGTCPIPKLGSALSSIGLVLTQQDIDALVERYRVSETDVSYVAFLDDLRKNPQRSYTDNDAFNATHASVSRSTPATTFTSLSTSASPSGPVHIDTSIGTVLRKLHYITKTQRIQFDISHNDFRTYDRLAKGVVDEATFKRVLANAYRVDGLSNAELETLISQYAVADPSYVAADAIPSNTTLSGRAQGTITAVAGNLRLVDYRAFIADLTVGQMGGDVYNIEREPTRVIDASAVGRPWIPEEENEVKVAYAPQAQPATQVLDANVLQDLLERLAAVTDAQRLDLESHFKDRDPLRSGCVNPRQFRTVVASVPLANPFTEEEWAVMLACYQRGSVGIGYRGFLADLATCESAIREAKLHAAAMAEERELQRAADEFSRTSKSYLPKIGAAGANLVATLNASTASVLAAAMDGTMGSTIPKTQLLTMAESVVTRIASEITRRRLSLRDALRAHDTLNQGLIPAARMHSVLTREGLVHSADEMAALAAKYGVTAVGATSSLGLRYNVFLDDIGERF